MDKYEELAELLRSTEPHRFAALAEDMKHKQVAEEAEEVAPEPQRFPGWANAAALALQHKKGNR